MFGIPKLNNSNVFAAETYEIACDDTGMFSFVFRIIQNALKLQRVEPAVFSSLADGATATKWIQLLQQAEAGLTVNAASVLNDLNIANQSPVQRLKSVVQSLPERMIKQLFSFRHRCAGCSKEDSFFVVNKAESFGQTCPRCNQRTIITKYPQIIFFQTGYSLRRSVDGEQFYLNSVLTQGQGQHFSLLVDFLSTQQDIFLLDDPCRVLSGESQLSYLKANLAKQYLDQSDTYGTLERKIGPKLVSCYYNASALSEAIQAKVQSAFNVIEPGGAVQKAAIQLQPTQTGVQLVSDSEEESEQGKQFRPSRLATNASKAAQPLPQQLRLNTKGKVNIFQLNWLFWLSIAFCAALFAASVIVMSVLTAWIKGTLVVNNLVISGNAYVGYDMGSEGIADLESRVENAIAGSVKESAGMQRLDATMSRFTVYTAYSNYLNANAKLSNITNLISPVLINCSNTSLYMPSMDISNVNAQVINATNTTIQVLNASQFEFQRLFDKQFPNVDRLVVTNLTAVTAYPKEISSTTQQTRALTVTQNLQANKLNTTATKADYYLAKQQAVAENMVSQSTEISQRVLSTSNFLFESGDAAFTKAALSLSDITFTNGISFDNITFTGQQINGTAPLSTQTLRFNSLNATTSVFNNASVLDQLTLKKGTFDSLDTQNMTIQNGSAASFIATQLSAAGIASQGLNISSSLFSTNQLSVNGVQFEPDKISCNQNFVIHGLKNVSCPTMFTSETTANKAAGGTVTSNYATVNGNLTATTITSPQISISNNTIVTGNLATKQVTSSGLGVRMSETSVEDVIKTSKVNLDLLDIAFLCLGNPIQKCSNCPK